MHDREASDSSTHWNHQQPSILSQNQRQQLKVCPRNHTLDKDIDPEDLPQSYHKTFANVMQDYALMLQIFERSMRGISKFGEKDTVCTSMLQDD
jgi:hypothetical protein